MGRHDPFGFWGRTASPQTGVVAVCTRITATTRVADTMEPRVSNDHYLVGTVGTYGNRGRREGGRGGRERARGGGREGEEGGRERKEGGRERTEGGGERGRERERASSVFFKENFSNFRNFRNTLGEKSGKCSNIPNTLMPRPARPRGSI